MNRTKKTRLFLLTGLLLAAYGAGASSADAKENVGLPVVEAASHSTATTHSHVEQEMLDGLQSLWWYEEERSLVLFTEEGFHYVELRDVTSHSAAVEAMQNPAFQYTVDEFFPDQSKMAVSRTTLTGFDEEYTLSADGKTMDVHFPEHEATFTYVYVGEAADIADVLMDKMSGGGAIEVPE